MRLGEPRDRMAEMNVALPAKQDLPGLGIVQHGEGGVFLRQALQGADRLRVIGNMEELVRRGGQ